MNLISLILIVVQLPSTSCIVYQWSTLACLFHKLGSSAAKKKGHNVMYVWPCLYTGLFSFKSFYPPF